MDKPSKTQLNVTASKFHDVFGIKSNEWANLVKQKALVCAMSETVVESVQQCCPFLGPEELKEVVATLEARAFLSSILSGLHTDSPGTTTPLPKGFKPLGVG